MKFEKEYFKTAYKNYKKQNPRRKLRSYLNEILKHKSSGKLLDIGCAYGSFLMQAQKHFQSQGVDISRHTIKIAKKRGLKVKTATAEKTRFKKNTFDIITMFDVIEHIFNLNSLFSEIHHILKPDGLLVLSIPVYDKVAGKIVSKIDKDPTHIHKKSRQFWLRILKQNNFKIISYKGILRYFFLKKYYVHTLTKPLRSHTPAIFIISQKEQTNVVNNNTSI